MRFSTSKSQLFCILGIWKDIIKIKLDPDVSEKTDGYVNDDPIWGN